MTLNDQWETKLFLGGQGTARWNGSEINNLTCNPVSVMKARSGQNHDNKTAPQVNFNPTAANIIRDMLCIFVIKQYFFQRVSNYF